MKIRKCRTDELHKVMAFISDEWAKDHVLSWHDGLMEFQHGDPDDPAHCNWLIASEGDELAAVLGYVPTRIYDEELGDRSVVFLALWKVAGRISNAGLGVKMLRAVEKIESGAAVIVLGINETVLQLYKALGYATGELGQFVLFADKANLKIAIAPSESDLPKRATGGANLVPVANDDLSRTLEVSDTGDRQYQLPQKGAAYFCCRYLDHPFYTYEVYQILISGVSKGILVTRMVEHEDARALRIIDAYCDPAAFAEIGPALVSLLKDREAEYVDIWQYGVSAEHFSRAGFERVVQEGDLIVPNFFEPFVARNGRIDFAAKIQSDDPLVLFRGDGDQDRPNMLPRTTGSGM